MYSVTDIPLPPELSWDTHQRKFGAAPNTGRIGLRNTTFPRLTTVTGERHPTNQDKLQQTGKPLPIYMLLTSTERNGSGNATTSGHTRVNGSISYFAAKYNTLSINRRRRMQTAIYRSAHSHCCGRPSTKDALIHRNRNRSHPFENDGTGLEP